jgi:hypothetical protein
VVDWRLDFGFPFPFVIRISSLSDASHEAFDWSAGLRPGELAHGFGFAPDRRSALQAMGSSFGELVQGTKK